MFRLGTRGSHSLEVTQLEVGQTRSQDHNSQNSRPALGKVEPSSGLQPHTLLYRSATEVALLSLQTLPPTLKSLRGCSEPLGLRGRTRKPSKLPRPPVGAHLGSAGSSSHGLTGLLNPSLPGSSAQSDPRPLMKSFPCAQRRRTKRSGCFERRFRVPSWTTDGSQS